MILNKEYLEKNVVTARLYEGDLVTPPSDTHCGYWMFKNVRVDHPYILEVYYDEGVEADEGEANSNRVVFTFFVSTIEEADRCHSSVSSVRNIRPTYNTKHAVARHVAWEWGKVLKSKSQKRLKSLPISEEYIHYLLVDSDLIKGITFDDLVKVYNLPMLTLDIDFVLKEGFIYSPLNGSMYISEQIQWQKWISDLKYLLYDAHPLIRQKAKRWIKINLSYADMDNVLQATA